MDAGVTKLSTLQSYKNLQIDHQKSFYKVDTKSRDDAVNFILKLKKKSRSDAVNFILKSKKS